MRLRSICPRLVMRLRAVSAVVRALSLGLVILGAAVTGVAGTGAAQTRTGAGPIDWQTTPVRLMLIDRVGCIYCEAWEAEIGPGYATSAAGRTAPLMRVDIDGPYPDGLALARRPAITPTFILLQNGSELDRLEGYPGARYFYPVLQDMLARAGIAGTAAP